MGATKETVAEYATKHGITEEAVRDIAGLDEPEAVEFTAELDGKNPAKVNFGFGSYKGDVILDVGGAGWVTKTVKRGKASHIFGTPGFHRVRADIGGEVRYLDVVTGVNTEDEDETPVEDVPLPIGAPDFSNTLMEPREGAPVEPVAGDRIAETDPLANTDPALGGDTPTSGTQEPVPAS